MKLRRPSHATVIAYVALFVALGGSTYAVTRIDSRDVADNSLRSKDLRNRKAVANRDVRPDSLTGEVIREGRLDAREFVTVGQGANTGACGGPSMQPTACAEVTVDVPTRSHALVIATGRYTGAGECSLRSGGFESASATFSEAVTEESFAVAGIHTFTAGRQVVQLVCSNHNSVHGESITVLGLGRFE